MRAFRESAIIKERKRSDPTPTPTPDPLALTPRETRPNLVGTWGDAPLRWLVRWETHPNAGWYVGRRTLTLVGTGNRTRHTGQQLTTIHYSFILIILKNAVCTRLCVVVCEYLVCVQTRFLFLKSGLRADQISCNLVCAQESCI